MRRIVVCCLIVGLLFGCTKKVDPDKPTARDISETKYSEEVDRYYEQTPSGYRAAFYTLGEVTVEEAIDYFESVEDGDGYYQYTSIDPDSWSAFVYFPIIENVSHESFKIEFVDKTLKVYLTSDNTLLDESYVLIYIDAPKRGDWPSNVEVYIDDVLVKMVDEKVVG